LTLQSFDTRLDWYAPGLRRTLEVLQPDVILCMGRMANCAAGHIVNIVQDRWPDAVVLATMRTGKCLPWRFRRSLSAVRHIIANSNAARTTLMQEHGISADKISVIHNPLVFPLVADGESAESTARATLRSNHGATARTTVLLNVAMFRPEKNQAELINSAAALPADFDWQLWLAGDGPTRAACEALSTRLSLTNRVKFLGFLRDPSAVYAAADLAVHASRSESLSNFLIEAQAHGLPAVAYEAQGIGECFLPGETGAVIARGRTADFCAAVRHYAAADAACRSRAREFARTTFAAPRQVQAHLDLFAKLAKV
jgi:glycosyltransferase involved in cell wall biosynthesis